MKARFFRALTWYGVPENKTRVRKIRNDVVAVVVAGSALIKTLQQAGVL